MSVDSFAEIGYGVMVESAGEAVYGEPEDGAVVIAFGWVDNPTAFAVVAERSWTSADVDCDPTLVSAAHFDVKTAWVAKVSAYVKKYKLKALTDPKWVLGVTQR